MFVTCYCDASYSNGEGSYAIWLKSKKGSKQIDGHCPGWIQDNNAAELYAAYIGIKEAIKIWPETTSVLVCSDSQSALRSLWPWANQASREDMQRVENLIGRLVNKYDLEIKTKHVKGHQRKNGSKERWLNNWCDKRAGKKRRRKK